jgi:hypothetical protein
MKGISNLFNVLVIYAVMYIMALFVSSVYIAAVYNIGIVPLFGAFNVTLPDITFAMFIFITMCFSAVKLLFKSTDKDNIIKTGTTEDIYKGLSTALSAMLSNFVNKGLTILILYIVKLMVF